MTSSILFIWYSFTASPAQIPGSPWCDVTERDTISNAFKWGRWPGTSQSADRVHWSSISFKSILVYGYIRCKPFIIMLYYSYNNDHNLYYIFFKYSITLINMCYLISWSRKRNTCFVIFYLKYIYPISQLSL